MIYTDIKSFADDLIDTDDTKFPVARKTRFANRALERVESLILSADGKIKFDDANYANQPTGTFALTSGTRSYSVKLDSGSNPIVKPVAVMVKDSSGTYVDVKIVDIRSDDGAAIRLGNGETGVPTKAAWLGKNLVFDYTPDYTYSDGVRIIFQRLTHPFEVGDTTAEPGFDHQFHALVPLWMAYWEGLKRGKQQVQNIRSEITVLEQQLVEFCQNMDQDSETVMTTYSYDPT